MSNEEDGSGLSEAPNASSPTRRYNGSGVSRTSIPPKEKLRGRPMPRGYIAVPTVMEWIVVARSALGLTHWLAGTCNFDDQDPQQRRRLFSRWFRDTENVRRVVQQWLVDGQLQAVGVSETGSLVVIPPDSWLRTYSGSFGGEQLPAIDYALADKDIEFFDASKGMTRAYPMLILRQLATAFGASSLPSYPSMLPDGLSALVTDGMGSAAVANPGVVPSSDDEPDRAAITPSGDLSYRLHVWMDGLATAFVMTGGRVKREDAIKAGMTKFGATYVQSETAYEALPWPEKRNPPRTNKA